MNNMRIAGALCLLAVSSSVQAENLMDIYRAAVDADPQLQAASHERDASAEVVTQAWAGYRPTVSLDYDQIQTTQDIISSDNAVFATGATDFPTTTWSLTLSQPVFRYANYVRIGQAKEEVKQADAELAQAKQELLLRVAEGYFGALSAEDDIGFLESERAAALEGLDVAQGREDAKVGRTIDRFDAEARVATVDADFAAADVARRDAYEQLHEMTGVVPSSLAPLAAKIDLVSPDPASDEQWVTQAIENNPAVVVQRHAVEVARREVSRQNAGHFPTVDLVFRNTNQLTEGTLFGGGSEVETQELMFRLNVPIYAGGSVSSKKREAVSRHSAAKSEMTRLVREVRRRTKEAYWNVTNAIKRVHALEKAVEAQEKTLSLRRVAFKARLETAISVLDAERDLLSAKRDLAQAKYDYLLNHLRLKSQVGALSEQDLLRVSGWLKG